MRFTDRQFLLCFGCQRGGTTWLAEQLRKHPGVDFPPRKEIRYLDPIYVHDFVEIQRQRIKEFRRRLWNDLGENPTELGTRHARELLWNAKYSLVSRESYDDEWYSTLFESCDPGRLTGDFSPDYSLLPEAGVEHLARILPHAKLIFVMRDPVDRLISGSTYVLRFQRNLSPADAEEQLRVLTKSSLQYQFSDYKTILSRFERHFPTGSILVLFQDDIALDPHGVITDVCNHAGIGFEPGWFPDPLAKSVNRSPRIPIPDDVLADARERMMPVLEYVSARFGSHAERWLATARSG